MITHCPSLLKQEFTSYSPQAYRELFDGKTVSPYLDFEFTTEIAYEYKESPNKISISGVQQKYPAVIDNGKIRLSTRGERSTHILKPAPWDKGLRDRHQIPANEHLTMQIASQIYGIKTAANGLCFSQEHRPVYITRRFDILPDNSKSLLEDFASVIGKTSRNHGDNYKYTGSYEDIAIALQNVTSSWRVETERLFTQLLFNYIYANGDAHLKNFSLILYDGEYRLSPAYDLMNTALHVDDDDFALEGGLSRNQETSDTMDRTGHPSQEDFRRFGATIGLQPGRVERILQRFALLPEEALLLIERSFLSAKSKRSYRRIIKERTSRFNRN